MPGRLGGLAETMKANMQGAIEVEKGAISGRIAQARRLATTGANEARGHVEGEYAASMAPVEAETAAAIGALDAEHSLARLRRSEGDHRLDDVNARFAAGRTQHEDKGPEYRAGNRARAGARGGVRTLQGRLQRRRILGRLPHRAPREGPAGCGVQDGRGLKDGFLRTANKKGYDLNPLRTQYRCAVIAGARQVNQTLDTTHSQLVSGLETGRTQAIAGLGAGARRTWRRSTRRSPRR